MGASRVWSLLRRGLLLGPALALALPGCTGAPTVPDGFDLVEGHGFTIALPQRWQVTGAGGEEVIAVGPDRRTGRSTVRVVWDGQLGSPLRETAYAATRLGALSTGPRRFVDERDAEVSGASSARRIESTWPVRDDDHEPAMRQVDLFTIRDGDLVYVGISGPHAEFGAVEAAILRSFRRVDAGPR